VSGLPPNVGKYEVLGEAGRGAMGVVYLGHDPVIDRQVAIKMYRVTDPDDEQRALTRRLFYNEARAAGGLDHPSILRVYEAGEVEGRPYIVMEYVPGGDTLRRYCEGGERLPVETVVDLVAQCARALDYAHQQGVTHRDIKPANVLLTPDRKVKIGDFGIALREQATATQALGSYGSPRYLSPEQACGDPATPRSDLYSLGVVLYELLTNTAPFAAANLRGLLYKVAYEEAPRVDSVRPDLIPSLVEVVRRALEKDPGRRFASGLEMAEALEAAGRALTQPVAPATAEQRRKALAGLAFFRDFGESEVSELLAVGTWETYRAGQRILEEGGEGQAFYVLVSGEVVVAKGDREIVRLGPGESFGEMAYLARASRTAAVLARSGVVCFKVAAPLTEWASLPCQLRLNRAFQQTLIQRLASTSEGLARSGSS
jgi:serine/threonine-protein kinase